MKKTIFALIFFTSLLSAQEKYTISGTINDVNNGETLFGASVYLQDTTIGVVTNEYGFYSITALQGDHTLIISYMGYDDIVQKITLNSDQKLNFEMSESSEQLDEIVITSGETQKINIKKPEMSTVKLKSETIKKIPVVLGEVDIIKSIQTLPGVTNSGEGSSGFNVRGGAVDQNLVLLDEAIIYNTSHLFGFFSVFNADAIKDVKLYKGGIPAKFGGRVSSVLDVRQKEGNNKRLGLTGGVGIISSRLAVEGPMFKQKGSFLVAGRTSYAHLFMKLSDDLKDSKVSFYDLNLKTNYKISDKNKLYLSGYFGRDILNVSKNFESSYGNASGNLRWNHIFTDKLFSNLSLIYSKYDYLLTINTAQFDWDSSIENYNLKYDLKYYFSNNLKLDFGGNVITYDFQPGEIKPTSGTSEINPMKLDQKRAFETGLYINGEHKVTEKLTAQYGLRYSYFSRLGGQSLANYANNQPVVYDPEQRIYVAGTEIGETAYKKSETIKNYGNLEPRVGLSFALTESSSLKAGYSRTAQYIHLLSNTVSVTPLDVWTPSGKFIKPQLSDQYAFGYFRNFNDDIYSLEVEAYYKTIQNRIDYRDGSDLIGNNHIETEILNGESRAYGLEFLLRKNKGDFTGWIAYTLAKAEQRTLGENVAGPGINEGKWYNANHDRTHDISITGIYKLSDKWTISSNLVFQTGRPVTYPNAEYTYENLSIANYSERNSNRLPAYHRLDISATYRPNKRPDKRWKGEWVFGIYNVYNRRNAASISFGQNLETGANEATRTAIFGLVPSITYNFKF